MYIKCDPLSKDLHSMYREMCDRRRDYKSVNDAGKVSSILHNVFSSSKTYFTSCVNCYRAAARALRLNFLHALISPKLEDEANVVEAGRQAGEFVIHVVHGVFFFGESIFGDDAVDTVGCRVLYPLVSFEKVLQYFVALDIDSWK